MPPLPAVPNVVRIKHTFTIGSDVTADTRMHFGYSGGLPSNADALTIAGLARAHFAANIIPLMGDSTTCTAIEVLDLSSPTGGVGTDTTASVGTRGFELLPAGAAALILLKIARRYRGGKPRMYWPFGVSSDLLTPTAWQIASAAAFLDGFNNYQVLLVGATGGTTVLTHLVNVSYYQGFTSVTNPITGRTKDVAKLRVGAPVVDAVTSLAINPAPGSQRRRNQTRP